MLFSFNRLPIDNSVFALTITLSSNAMLAFLFCLQDILNDFKWFEMCFLNSSFTFRYPQAILLSPTYELASQTGHVVETMAKYMQGFTMRYAVKGERVSKGDVVSELLSIVLSVPT